MKRLLLIVTAALLAPVSVWPQSADELEALMDAPALTYAAVAAFVLEAADAPSPPEAAFRFARERQWLPSRIRAEETARLGPVSLLIMRAFGLKGGLSYTFFPNAHFAYRELSHRRIIQGRADPELPVSGDWLLFMTGRVLAARAGEDLGGGAQ